MADLGQRRRAEVVVFKLASGDLDQLGALGQIVGAAVFEGRFAAAGNVARLRHGRLPTPQPAAIPHLFISYYQEREDGSARREDRHCHRGVTRQDRKSVVEGKSVSVRVDLGGSRIIKKKKDKKSKDTTTTK